MTNRIKDRLTEAAAALVITGIVAFSTGYFGVMRGQAIAEAKMEEQDRRISKVESELGDLSKAFTDGNARLRDEVSALRADTSYIRGKIEARQP